MRYKLVCSCGSELKRTHFAIDEIKYFTNKKEAEKEAASYQAILKGSGHMFSVVEVPE